MASVYDDERWADIEEWMRDIRRTIHRYPELGLTTPRTADLVQSALDALNIPHQRPIPYGIKAFLGPQTGTGALLLRADMDGLPIMEDTGLSFQSEIPGSMHACGHDAHTAMLLGAARYLKAREPDLVRPVVLMFQPGEEGPGGALPMIREGILDNPGVSRAAMIHVSSELPVGVVGLKEGPTMGACDDFRIVIHGRGGHGSSPHRGVDAIMVAASLLQFIQTWVSREQSPLEPLVISVGTIAGGYRENIIADRVEMTGTIRTLHRATRERVTREFADRIRRYVANWRATAEVELNPGYPAFIADVPWTRTAAAILEDALPEGAVRLLDEPTLGVEDFAYIAERVPAVHINVGIVGAEFRTGLHSAGFILDEQALRVGAACYAALAMKDHYDDEEGAQ